jgi:hypothetical protein
VDRMTNPSNVLEFMRMPKVHGWVVVRLLMSCGWVLCTIISVGRSMGRVLEALSCI